MFYETWEDKAILKGGTEAHFIYITIMPIYMM